VNPRLTIVTEYGIVTTTGAVQFYEVEIRHDGSGRRDWVAGVGLIAMRERIAELGGTLTAGPAGLAGTGGQVLARLPL
jgi:two-component system, NarL family, sensor kinase